ncbi:MAG TPA: V-type ATP synthase subunit A, partial [Turneriella sp.]|nr:V-type ATP synthase subunit A [Turneriella sp.]
MENKTQTRGKVTGVLSNLVSIEADGPVGQNEICYIELGGVRLMAEVIRVAGNVAQAQVFESTRGIRSGDNVEFTGHMLEISLGPGILSRKYDGLQNDLDRLTGLYLSRGQQVDPLDTQALYDFTPLVSAGAAVESGDWLGEVP